MVDFTAAKSAKDVVEDVRALFRSYVPESDAWALPNVFSVTASVVGGLFWSAFNEVRRGIDRRLNPQTAVGEFLDIVASNPPLGLIRQEATPSIGQVSVNIPSLIVIPIGYNFTASDGTVYTATENVTLTNGEGVVSVISSEEGANQNSLVNRPLSGQDAGEVRSLGIFGGFDRECDDNLRQRIFAAQSACVFTASGCAYQREVQTIQGVTRSWTVEDGGAPVIYFLMEDKYDCGKPLQEDIDTVVQHFMNDCKANLFFCPIFRAPEVKTISPEIQWDIEPEDMCLVQGELQTWLRANYGIGEGISRGDIQTFLRARFPSNGASIDCECEDFPPCCNEVYTCVELVGGC